MRIDECRVKIVCTKIRYILSVGNKLSDQHIQYKESIQNARLAIQVLSKSVADALKMLENEDNKMFKGSASTVEFCQMMNQGFEILNVRSVFGNFIRHQHGQPLNDTTENFLRESAVQVIKYIKGLVQYNGTPILQCR